VPASSRDGTGAWPAPPRGVGLGLAACGLLSLGLYGLGPRLVLEREHGTFEAYAVLSLALVGLYLGAVALVLRWPTADRVWLGGILGLGLAFRLALLPTPVFLSSDLYRYLWDGRVQLSGINPYRHPPSAPALAFLRDPAVHPHINRPDARTVYPPGAEVVFAAVAAVAPNSIPAWRLVVLASDAATAWLLLGLLSRMGVAASAVLVYAWAPLVVFEGTQAGHVDFLMLPWLLLALRWRQGHRPIAAGVALGLATLVKLYPAVLLAAWHRRWDWRFPAAWVATMAAGYLPYTAGVGAGVTGFLPQYFGSAEDFNIGLRAFLSDPIAALLGPAGVGGLGGLAVRGAVWLGHLDPGTPLGSLLSPADEATLRHRLGLPTVGPDVLVLVQAGHELLRALAVLLLLGGLALTLWWIGRRAAPGARGVFGAAFGAVAAYLVLIPTAMHAWYAVWVLPFVAVRPSPAWLWFTGTVSLSYLKYGWEPLGLPLWVRLVEFAPLYALLVWEGCRGRGTFAEFPLRRATSRRPPGGVAAPPGDQR
jgi:hypothetical protein